MTDDIDQRRQQNKYAREVLSGSQVQLSHRPVTPQAASSPERLPSNGATPVHLVYLAAVAVLLVIGVVVYGVSGFEPASIMFFLLSLALMAGWFVF